jgi:hypothetical protein
MLDVSAPNRNHEKGPWVIVESSVLVGAHKAMEENSDSLSANQVPPVKIWLALAVDDYAFGEETIEKSCHFLSETAAVLLPGFVSI